MPSHWNKDPWPGQTVVYRYGCPVDADFGAGKARDDVAIEQLFLANRFWNALVEAERAHETKREEIQSRHPVLGHYVEAKEQAQAQVRLLEQLVKDERARLHLARERGERLSRDAIDELLSQLSTARQRRKEAGEQLKAAKAETREVLGPEYAAAEAHFQSEKSRLHKQAYGPDGLYWPTALDVVRRFDTARRRMISERADGQPSELVFHRFDATGTLAMIFNGGRGGRTFERLSGPQGYQGVRIEGEGKYRTLVMRITGVKQGNHNLVVPFVAHRPIPDAADISEIRVTRRRVGVYHRISVAFTCLVPQVAQPEGGNVVAVKLHWRQVGNGQVEVAHVSSSGAMGPLRPPAPKKTVVPVKEFMAKISPLEFYVDGEMVTWGRATAAQHLARANYQRLEAQGKIDDASRHEFIATLIEKRGVTCLDDIDPGSVDMDTLYYIQEIAAA